MFFSCDNEQIIKEEMQDIETCTFNEAIDLTALAMAKALKNDDLRQIIKTETNKQFDYDFDVLYRFIENMKIKVEGMGEVTIGEFLISQIEDELKNAKYVDRKYFENLSLKIPNLNICVPFQYENSWQPSSCVPSVASFPADFADEECDQVRGFDAEGNNFWITRDDKDWKNPVIIVGLSKRVDEQGYLKVNAGSLYIEKENRCITADEAYGFASDYAKAGNKPHFEPIYEVVDNDFFERSRNTNIYQCVTSKDEETIELNHNEDIEENKCVNPTPTTFLTIHPAIDYSGAVTFSWQDMGAVQYEIWRGIGSATPTLYATVAGTTQNFTNAYLNNGVIHCYKIRYKDANGCYSVFTPTVNHVIGWRKARNYEHLEKIYLDGTCWNDISWGKFKMVVKIIAVKYNFAEGRLEYPPLHMGEVYGSTQINQWRTYNKELFLWDMTKYASNYWIYFYEEDGGNPIEITIGTKLWIGNPMAGATTPAGGEVSVTLKYTVDTRDDKFGFYEVYNHSLTNLTNGIDIQPPKGQARAIINSY
jgi:hypothetical protein